MRIQHVDHAAKVNFITIHSSWYVLIERIKYLEDKVLNTIVTMDVAPKRDDRVHTDG